MASAGRGPSAPTIAGTAGGGDDAASTETADAEADADANAP
jgi:hypothetical protein